MSGQLRATADLPPGKELRYPLNRMVVGHYSRCVALWIGDKIDAIIVDFSKAFDLVPHGRLLTKIANSGVDSRVVVWIENSF